MDVFEFLVACAKLLAPAVLTCSVALFIASKFLTQHVEKEKWGVRRSKFEELAIAISNAAQQSKDVSGFLETEKDSPDWKLQEERRKAAIVKFIETRQHITTIERLYEHLFVGETKNALQQLHKAFKDAEAERKKSGTLQQMTAQLAKDYEVCRKALFACAPQYYLPSSYKFWDISS